MVGAAHGSSEALRWLNAQVCHALVVTGNTARRFRGPWLFVGIGAAVLVILAIAVAGWAVVSKVAPSGPPYHPHNLSWRYGEDLMQTKLYGTLRGNVDVAAVCRAAMESPANPPANFDRKEAVAGCRYGEWVYDN